MREFTVFGFWNDADEPVPVAVVELIGGGHMDIGGGEGCSEGGPWATSVEAVDMESAEGLAVEEMLATQGDEEEEYNFPFEELDDRFTKLPNPSDPTEADHWEHEDAIKMPTRQVWTIVEGDSGKDWWALTGFHIVNKLFYVVTKEEWTDEDSNKEFRY